jgi:hypothetical protein
MGETPAAPGKAPTIDGGLTLALSEGSDSNDGGGWESTGKPPPALGKPPTSDGGSTLRRRSSAATGRRWRRRSVATTCLGCGPAPPP